MPASSRYNLPTGLPEVDVRALNRDGLLAPGMRTTVSKSFAGRIVCTAVVDAVADNEVVVRYEGQSARVAVVHTAQHLGGMRAWFSCPYCRRGCAILYPFVCRRCASITYPSQREAPHHRALRRAQVLRVRLGGSGNMTEPLPPRPWGMWDRTYRRRIEECRSADARSLAGMASVLQHWRDTWGRPAG